MGEGLLTLLWLDWTAFGHRMRNVLRDPKRLWVWVIFIGWFALVVVGKAMSAKSGGNAIGLAAAAPAVGALIPGAYLIIVGLIWHGAARRAPAALSSPADGRFLLASDLSPRVVVFWLQLRQAWGLTRGVLLNALIWVAILLPSPGISMHGVLLGMLAILPAILLLYGLRLPVFVLARRYPRLPVAGAGLVIAAVGAVAILWQLFMAVQGTAPFSKSLLSHHVALPLGTTVAQAIGGQGGPIALLFALSATALMLSAGVADDCYPEIWETSVRAFAVRKLARRGRFGFGGELRNAFAEAGAGKPHRKRRAAVDSSDGTGVPAGAWVLLWKEWLALRRSPSGIRGAALWMFGAAAAGAVLGTFAARQHQASAEGMIVGIAIYPALFLATASGVSLSADLRRPLWWLSSESLLKRLAIWTLATSLRAIALIVVGLLAASVAAGTMSQTVFVLPLGAAAIWLLRAIGLAVYALLPSQTDLRGPGALLRLLLTLVLLVPAAALAGVAGAISQDVTAALLVGAVSAAVEGGLLVLFAASLLRGNGMAVAQAEQR
ncbi:MAG: hypothetical protein M0Z66_02435 [Thermaerobacter sp.]|nr:hypothetical protein [Thermaerobacter sp.]